MKKKISAHIIKLLCILFIAGVSVDAWAGTKGANFKVPARGTLNYTVDVPPNTKALYITVKDQSQMLTLEVFQPGSRSVSCRTTTWTSSIGLKNPLQCSFNKPKPGKWKIKVMGSVHVSNVDKYPFVTGQLIIKMTGGQPKPPSPGTGDDAPPPPPGHPKVAVPQGPAGRSTPVPEAGKWFPSATTIEYDSRLKGYIKKGDYDMYKFYFPGGNLKAYSKGNLDLVSDLLNSKQERVARDRSSGSGNNFMFQGNYPAGLYYIQIRVMHHGGQGPYELILGNGQDWSFIENQ